MKHPVLWFEVRGKDSTPSRIEPGRALRDMQARYGPDAIRLVDG